MALKISVRKQFLTERKNSGQRMTIGFAGIADLRTFISLEYIKGMVKACADYDINFVNMGGSVSQSFFDDIDFISRYTKNFKFMRPPFVDGMITWAATLRPFMNEETIVKTFGDLRPLPMVDIGQIDIPGVSMLKIDSNAAIKSVMEHLVNDHHFTKFAFIGPDNTDLYRRRLIFYQHELSRRGLVEIEGATCPIPGTKVSQVDDALDRLTSRFDLHDRREIEVIVTTTDVVASKVIEQLSQRGISVPKDVAVTGFNNWYDGIVARSPLTTIDLSFFKRGYTAVEMLIDRIIEPEKSAETILFPTSLVIRQSCGCFEQSVEKAGFSSCAAQTETDGAESEDSLRRQFIFEAKQIFPYLTESNVADLIDSFFADMYDPHTSSEEESKSRTLIWFQNVLQNCRMTGEFDSDHFQNAVSALRSLFMQVLKSEPVSVLIYMENIFHQMRTLVSVFQKYEAIADRENPYQLNNIAAQAVSFVSATNMEQIFEMLRQRLGELDIPGAVVALSDTMSFSFPVPEISFVFPETSPELQQIMHQRISEPHLFPKTFFSNKRHYAVMLEILHYADRYFGYALFEMKSPNIAIYDALRMLLSNALYTVYKKEGRVKNQSFTITDTQVQDIVRPVDASSQSNGRARITGEKITAYLTAHLNEMTDIEKMADALMVSKSFLSKKCKELTGQSVQTLHEKLKIEQAKNMLQLGKYELSHIAAELGFANQNYFSTVFKKNTGISPRNWLKRNG